MYKEKCNVLVLEDISIFANLVNSLYQQINGGEETLVLVTGNKKEDVKKVLELIIEPFTTDVNERKILTKLYTELSTSGNELYMEEKINVEKAAFDYLDQLVIECDIPLEYDDTMDINSIIKLFNVKIRDDSVSLIEKIIFYVKMCIQIKKVKVVGFVNLKSYLSSEDLLYLYEYARYNEVYLVLIENRETCSLENENICILDQDSCLITY